MACYFMIPRKRKYVKVWTLVIFEIPPTNMRKNTATNTGLGAAKTASKK